MEVRALQLIALFSWETSTAASTLVWLHLSIRVGSINNHVSDWLGQAGAFAAFTVDILVYPLDTLKTRIQSPDYRKIYYGLTKNTMNRRLLFHGLYQGVRSFILITIPSCKGL